MTQPDEAAALRDLATLISARTGLAAIQPQVARRLIAARLALRATNWATLTASLEQSPLGSPAWQAVIDAVLVPETFLFRDSAQLSLMVTTALRPAIARAGRGGELRLWSAGCCTGEEAWSLAILAMQALCAEGAGTETPQAFAIESAWRCDVLGSDISASVLDRAHRGVYRTGPLSSFRDTAMGYLHYFPRSGTTTRTVRADIRPYVRFERSGLLDADPGSADWFDAVVCRNVLVYFTGAARAKALQRLAAAVKPGGVLVLGPTDPAPGSMEFSPVWSRHALVYQRAGPG